MNKRWFYLIAIPLVFSNLCVNVYFWSSHVNHVAAQLLAGAWAIGLTSVEFIFPVWAIQKVKDNTAESIVFGLSAVVIALFSILVFAMTIEKVLDKPFAEMIHNQKVQDHNEEVAKARRDWVSTSHEAAKIAVASANRLHELDKISLGSIPAIEKFHEISDRALREIEKNAEVSGIEIQHHSSLSYLFTLSKVLGVSAGKIKLLISFVLAALIELVAVLSVIVLMRSSEDVVVGEEEDEKEITTLQIIRRDILNGVHGKIPVLSKLPDYYRGTGVRFEDVQDLRNTMLSSGELIAHGKNRVKLASAS